MSAQISAQTTRVKMTYLAKLIAPVDCHDIIIFPATEDLEEVFP